jgi:hypothetical protein
VTVKQTPDYQEIAEEVEKLMNEIQVHINKSFKEEKSKKLK